MDPWGTPHNRATEEEENFPHWESSVFGLRGQPLQGDTLNIKRSFNVSAYLAIEKHSNCAGSFAYRWFLQWFSKSL